MHGNMNWLTNGISVPGSSVPGCSAVNRIEYGKVQWMTKGMSGPGNNSLCMRK